MKREYISVKCNCGCGCNLTYLIESLTGAADFPIKPCPSCGHESGGTIEYLGWKET